MTVHHGDTESTEEEVKPVRIVIPGNYDELPPEPVFPPNMMVGEGVLSEPVAYIAILLTVIAMSVSVLALTKYIERVQAIEIKVVVEK